MKIVAITDVHGNWASLKRFLRKIRSNEVDLVIVAGDLSFYGDLNEALGVLSVLSKRYRVFFVPGNCDSPSLLNVEKYGNSENLHGKIVDYNGAIFAGIGGSNPTPFNTPIEFMEYEIKNVLLKIREKLGGRSLDVFVSHPPPYNTKLDVISTGEHVGSLEVRQFVENIKPKLCICGHIHEASGIDNIGETILVNPGPLAHGNYSVIELKKHNVNVKILKI